MISRRTLIQLGCLSSLPAITRGASSSDEADDQWGRLAGRAMTVELSGETLGLEEAAFLRRHQFRSFILFTRNVTSAEQTRRLIADLRIAVGDEIVVSIDNEGGSTFRTAFLPAAPSPLALAAIGDEGLAEKVGAAVARGLISLGINWNLAPVLDLNSNPRNPILLERAFGSDPRKAARLAMAWTRGHLEQGVATCIKHFPGKGDTQIDAHLDLPTIRKPRETLDAVELSLFREQIKLSPGVMVSHVVFPAFDPKLPASLSPAVTQTLLHDQMGFAGVTTTDALDMGAIRKHWGQPRGAVMAIQAGADLALVLDDGVTRDDTAASHAALKEAARQGAIGRQRLLEANARVDALIRRFPCVPQAYALQQEAADRALFASVWQRALTLVGPVKRPKLGSHVRLIVPADAPADGVSEEGLTASTLTARLLPLYRLDVVTYEDPKEIHWSSQSRDGAFTIVASTTRDRYSRSVSQTWRPDLQLALWNPYVASDLPCPTLLSYGFAPPALDAVVGWLKGELEATGVLPVKLDV
ncbi:MAG: glycoside hydrolase family 3 protein [Paucibacter sp.]|nr:glycoside hydrolase family 3 protein [Roseateles sp.]